MLTIGLTGSIGIGKSTVAKMFEDLGVPVFDADAAVHDLYSPGGKAVPLIRAVFPDSIAEDGSVDRVRLGAHMRSDPLNLDVLTSFIHPWVGERRAQFISDAKKANAPAVLFDVPLLFETGGDQDVDVTIVVSASADIQRERVLARPDMTRELFENLLARQMPDDQKRARADHIIWTDIPMEETHFLVKTLLSHLLNAESSTNSLQRD